MAPATLAREHTRSARFPSFTLVATITILTSITFAAASRAAEATPQLAWGNGAQEPPKPGKRPAEEPEGDKPTVEPGTGPKADDPQRPRRRLGGTRRERRDSEADRAALRALPVSRAKELIESAGDALADNNQTKAQRRAENALTILEGHIGENGVRDLEFDAKWIVLRSRFQQKRDVKLAEEFRALDTAYPGRLAFADHWQTGVDLAFTEEWDASRRLLEDAAKKFPERAERLKSFARFVESVRAADAAYTGEAPSIDPNYEGFLERSRPDDPDELFEYAMRTSGMKVWDKTLIALRDARARLTDDPESDPKRVYLLAFNEVRTWIAIADYETAAAEFERLASTHGDRIDWISWLQIGKDLADSGARGPARQVLESGKARFADQAARFDREIEKL